MQISLNVYDVTNTPNENTNGMITRLNSITRELNLGGVFHGAVQLEDLEWSFGYCESGTGVYCCRARSNSLYTFREHIELGATRKTKQEIREILSRFKRAWPGSSYDLLQRNCCHFCEDLCLALEVPSPPAWLNRFAQGADATVKFTNEASALAKRVGSNISFTAQQSALWFREISQRVLSQIALPSPTSDASAAGESGGGGGGSAALAADCDGNTSSPRLPTFRPGTSPTHTAAPGMGSVSRSWGSFSGAADLSGGGCSGGGGGGGGSSVGRFPGRLRPFSAAAGAGGGSTASPGPPEYGGGGGGDGGCSGLPASRPASCCDLSPVSSLPLKTSALTAAQQGGASRSPPPSAAAAATPAQQQQQQSAAGQSSPLAAALRQKWLELEASAGDGTKQFLLGLVKTRQTRLAEEEEVASPAGAGGSYSAAAEGGQTSRSPRSEGGRDVWPVTTATHGSHGMMAYAGPLSVAPAAAAAAAAAVHDESTRPPALQLISHSLMSPDVLVGASGLSAAAAAASTAVVGVEAGVVSAESPAAAAGAESPPTSGSTGPRATASASASVTQARHLLDM